MQAMSLTDNFEYVGFRYSKEEIGEMLTTAGSLVERHKQYHKAYDIYSQLIDAIPNSASFYACRAMISMQMKDKDSTINDFGKAIEYFELQENIEAANALKRILERTKVSDFFEQPTLE